ncbi:hypothetical protein [Leadbetterella byssophila]|uniref:hypothetical protein n=1 Tax=Leadbetterella byssophila TaxID=316068 RepID=UPI0039A13142
MLFTFFIFDLSANDQIITDKVYEKIEASLAQEQSRNQQVMNPTQCFIGTGSVTCYGSCIPGPHFIATLPESSSEMALEFTILIAESICPGCSFKVNNIILSPGDCLIIP